MSVSYLSTHLDRLRRSFSTGSTISWLVFFGFVLFTLWFTWPLALNPISQYYGAPGDLTGGISVLRELVQAPSNPFLPGHISDFGAPEGTAISWTVNVGTFASTVPMWLIALLVGPVFAFNMLAVAGFVASGQAMFLLARHLTGSAGAGVIVGWAFAFFPFMVISSWAGHLHTMHGWLLVVVLWRMLELDAKPNRRNGVLAGCAAVLCFAWTPYFLLIGGVLFITLAIVGLARSALTRTVRRYLPALAWASAPVLVFGLLLQVVTRLAQGSGNRQHPLSELTAYGARAYEYVVPHSRSVFFAPVTRDWLAVRMHGSNDSEATLYLGVIVLLLAALGIAVTQLKVFSPPRARAVAAALVAVGLVAFACSAPPQVVIPFIGLPVNTPPYFIHKLIPDWRVYSRFVVLLMMAVCLLAAYGIAWLSKRKSKVASSLVMVVIAVLVAADLWTQPDPGWVHQTVRDPIYSLLRKQPPGLVAEYPLEPYGVGDYSAEFNQDAHGNPIINGFGENTSEGVRASALVSLADPTTARRLAALGVRYVINVKGPISPGATDPGPPSSGLREIGTTDYATLYRVVAVPIESSVVGVSGFEPAEGRFQWLSRMVGALEVDAVCESCVARVRFSVSSFAVSRSVTVRGSDGNLVARLRVGSKPRFVTVPVDIRGGRGVLRVSASPGPQRISEAIGGEDNRSVSLWIGEAKIVNEK